MNSNGFIALGRGIMCLFLLTVSLMVQAANPVKVTGRVTDTTGELMIGVTIQEKGTSNGTITDMNLSLIHI